METRGSLEIESFRHIPAPARGQGDLFTILTQANTPALPERIALAIEHYIAGLTPEKQSAARQELPYLVQFGPVLLKYGKRIPDIKRVNPGIRYGGLTEYDKSKIYDLLPVQYQLQTSNLLQDDIPSFSQIEDLIVQSNLQFPLMMKANKGERGTGIYYIPDKDALKQHWKNLLKEKHREPSSLQDYCDYQHEYCLQFYRQHGKIEAGSLTLRDIPYVLWNGQDTIQSLIEQLPIHDAHKQAIIQKISITENTTLHRVPADTEQVQIVRTASIDFGTKYKHIQLSPEQTTMINHLLNQILVNINQQMLNVGRFDLKANSLEELIGWNVKVIELNAGGGIPTHVYDESLSVQQKYGELYAHFDRMVAIAKANKFKAWYSIFGEITSRSEFFSISQKSIKKKGIEFFNRKNKKAQQIKTIYRTIIKTLQAGRNVRWKRGFRKLMEMIYF